MLFRHSRVIELKNPAEIEIMRVNGHLLAGVMREVCAAVQVGVSTFELDQLARGLIERLKAKPAFLGYHGFPATLCTSVNEQVVHGIPSRSTILREGDIISIDCGLIRNGFVADMARTMTAGKIAPEVARLIATTQQCLDAALALAAPGNRLGDIGRTVSRIAEEQGFGIVEDYTGHGIGRRMHEEPKIPNYFDAEHNVRLKTGMVLAIEPMINLGTGKTLELDDEWTVITADGLPSAHIEDSVAVTEDGPLILTRP